VPSLSFLIKRIDRNRCLPGLQPLPIREQFLLVQFCPCLHEASLPPRNRPGNQLDGIEAEYRDVILL
jgi:hypothetical protein